MESVFELYPREVYVHQFADAYHLHVAAGETYKLSHTKGPDGHSVAFHAATAQEQQRATILRIAAKLMVLQRNKLLDEFCTDWLRFRHLPVPERENESKSGVDLQRPSPPNEGVQGAVRTDPLSAESVHHQSAEGSAQPAGGVTVP